MRGKEMALNRHIFIMASVVAALTSQAGATDRPELLGCWRLTKDSHTFVQLCFAPEGRGVKLLQMPDEGLAEPYRYNTSGGVFTLQGIRRCDFMMASAMDVMTLDCGPDWPNFSGSFIKRCGYDEMGELGDSCPLVDGWHAGQQE
jgi:hypothetical protein